MTSDSPINNDAQLPAKRVELPRPTAAPIVVSLGLTLCAMGLATNLALLVTGAMLSIAGLSAWVAELLPGRGHVEEPVELGVKPAIVVRRPVERLVVGRPGYRLRLPEQVHPISAGVKGGIFGGLVMPAPAILYGVLSGHGIWYSVNLLAGMALPGIGDMSVRQLEQFHLTLALLGLTIHVVMSVVFGLLYGVLMPTLPTIPKPLAWGGLLMPLFWTSVSFLSMGLVNPLLRHRVEWSWFILSQFVFGLVTALVVMRLSRFKPIAAGICGGLIGGALMSIPALVWSLLTGHGPWYPINLLAGMALPGMDQAPAARLERFDADWFVRAVAIHAAISATFGAIYGQALRRLQPVPAPLAWGGILLPLLWTAASYGLMGVVNPALQRRVDWPWFIASQFVFGVAAAIVVVRSEAVSIPAAGTGPEPLDMREGS